MIPFIKKYEPKNSNEIIGQDGAIANIKGFIQDFKNQKNKSLILYGPPGCGKTSSVYAIANELDLELIEVNASDFRNKDMINATIGNASQQMSLFMKQKVILIDEIDGLSGQKDRGGIAEITRLIDETKFPLIMTSQNPFELKFKNLKKKSDLVQLDSLDPTSIFNVLKKICENENIQYDETSLKGLARRSGGDLRGSIIDLQILSAGTNSINNEVLDELSGRKQTESMLQALVKVFKTTDAKIAISAFDNVNEDLDQCFLWIDENLPQEYKKGKDLAKAYQSLSMADVFKSRIRRWQYWRFLVYVNTFLTAGIATAKDEKYKEFFQYKPTMRLLRIWQANMSNAKKKSISEKLAKLTHTSIKNIVNDFELYRLILKSNNKLVEQLELSDDEVKWIKK
tara:strand:- start:160 stop:1353 length:1194 start_codon:yes stop_codon:yes gene_type:complete